MARSRASSVTFCLDWAETPVRCKLDHLGAGVEATGIVCTFAQDSREGEFAKAFGGGLTAIVVSPSLYP